MTEAKILLSDLHAAGYVLAAHGDRLRFKPASMPSELFDRLRTHKAALLRLLADPTVPRHSPRPNTDDWRLTTLGCGPVLHHAGFTPEADPWPAPRVSITAASPVDGSGRCRCGATQTRDVPIHNGASIRRDCAACGRFVDFPVWRETADNRIMTHDPSNVKGK